MKDTSKFIKITQDVVNLIKPQSVVNAFLK